MRQYRRGWSSLPFAVSPATYPPGERAGDPARGASGKCRMTSTAAVPKKPEPAASGADTLDTFPKMLMEHARLRPDRPAMREKDYGIWQGWTWGEVAAE